MWKHFRSMLCNGNSNVTAENIALHMNISHEDLEHLAEELVFSQPGPPMPQPVLVNEGIVVSTLMYEVFTILNHYKLSKTSTQTAQWV